MELTDNARTLFDKLSLDYVQEEIVGKEFESNWLECKEKQRVGHPGADEGDISAFAKALSGFGNTSGGVLIFGLEAHKKEDIDRIISIKEIPEIDKFASQIRELESRKIERLVVGVEYKIIPSSKSANNVGLLAIYIPQSKSAPHRSLVDNKFYIRAGGTFASIAVNQIGDLFQRGYRPELKLLIKSLGGNSIKVCLSNISHASAKNVYLVFSLPTGFHATKYGSGGVRLSPCNSIGHYKDIEKNFIEYGREETAVLHPGAEIYVIPLVATDGVLKGKKIEMEYFIYADNMSETHGTLNLNL